MRSLFVFSNLGIFLGYVVIGALVLPRTTEFVRRLVPFVVVRLRFTQLGGFVFFTTCGLTHLEQVLHVTYEPRAVIDQVYLTWHMQLIHVSQVIGVWMLILGVLYEFAVPVSRAILQREREQGYAHLTKRL